jgi:hypothetical protein
VPGKLLQDQEDLLEGAVLLRKTKVEVIVQLYDHSAKRSHKSHVSVEAYTQLTGLEDKSLLGRQPGDDSCLAVPKRPDQSGSVSGLSSILQMVIAQLDRFLDDGLIDESVVLL